MKLLAIGGSAALAIYFIIALALTFYNVSRHIFSLDEDPNEETGLSFFARQSTILLWPLVAISSEGREFLRTVWKGRE